MADKYTFSIEDTLLDALGFLKKMGITMLDATLQPWRLVVNTYEKLKYDKKDEPKDPSKNPKNTYVSHFLYFVIWLLLFLSYYRSFSFNRYNNIAMKAQDVIRETNSYLNNTSTTEKLLLYLPVILAMYFLVTLCACLMDLLIGKYLLQLKEGGFYFFRRILYYVIATALMLQLVPVFVCELFGLEESMEERIGKFIGRGYLIWIFISLAFSISDKGGTVPKGFFDFGYLKKVFNYCYQGLQYTALIVLLIFITEKIILRNYFTQYMMEVGYLDYAGKVSLIDFKNGINAKNNTITLYRTFNSDSAQSLQTHLVVANNWQDIIVHNQNALIIHCITSSDKKDKNNKPIMDTLPLYFDIRATESSDSSNAKQGTAISGNSLMELRFQSVEPLSKGQIEALERALEKPNDSMKVIAEMHYLPYITHDRVVGQDIKLVMR